MCELKPTSTGIDDMRVFPFFTQWILEGLKPELPLYLSKADGASTEMIKLQWWQTHEKELPRLQVVLIYPSSAAAESVYSLLTNSFNERQNSSLGI